RLACRSWLLPCNVVPLNCVGRRLMAPLPGFVLGFTYGTWPCQPCGWVPSAPAVPSLIAHAPVCVHDNAAEMRTAVREQFQTYPRLPFYRQMLIAAGFPEAADGTWSDAMIDTVVLWGNEACVTERLHDLFA